MRKLVLAGLAVLLVTLAYRSHTRRSGQAIDPAASLFRNAAVPAEIGSMLKRACFDCHSAETRWPWYSHLPVVGELLERDVTGGRAQLNFSRWTEYNPFDRASLLDKACTEVSQGRMPLKPYLLMHRDARLSANDAERICGWTRDEITRLVQGGP